MQRHAVTIGVIAAMIAASSAHGRAAESCGDSPMGFSASLLAFFPPAAMAAHKGGHAVLKCGRTERDVMSGCKLISERPADQGFGAAALEMAAMSKEAPTATISASQRRPREVIFRFGSKSPCIWPNVVDEPWMPVAPLFAQTPDFAEFRNAVSAVGANEPRLSASAVVFCRVEVGGRLTGCTVVKESPEGEGFGKAALLLTKRIALRPTTPDGVPVAGTTITMTVPFGPQLDLGFQ